MSASPSDLLDLRRRLLEETGLPGDDIGISGDTSHLLSGGYHCGAHDLLAINAVSRDDYSIRQPRDRARYNQDLGDGDNDAAAMDVGDDWPRGGRAAWIRFNNLLRAQLGANDPALAAVRGMNFTPDGITKRRFDHRTNTETNSTDTVTWHTHIEWWRDTIATHARWLSTRRIVAIAHTAITGEPLDPPPNMGVSMEIFTVTNCPAGTTDVAGVVLVEGGQYFATPKGLFGLTGAEFFSQPSAIQPNRMAMTYPRAIALCNALSQKPATPAEIAAAVAAQFPNADVTQQVILDAINSPDGHAAFVAILATPEGQAALARAADYAEDH
jgi:hypothetical protein